MVLRMSRPTTRKGTANPCYRKRIPADVKRVLDQLPAAYRPRGWGKEEIVITLGTADRRAAGAEFARIAADVEVRFAALRAGVRRLSHKEATALAGAAYRELTAAHEDDPGAAVGWLKEFAGNELARQSHFVHGPEQPAFRPLTIPTGDTERATMEHRFGAEADSLLSREGLIVDDESRHRLIAELAKARDDAALRLARNAEGDYRPDPAAERFPEWTPAAAKPDLAGCKKLTLLDMFDNWAAHPEQAQQARGTLKRYKSVFTAVMTFLNNPDARTITTADLQRYVEARMAGEGVAKLQPKVARNVHKAALRSVYGWSVGKRLVPNNPAEGVRIKVARAKRLRSKDASDEEAQALARAALGTPEAAPAGSLDAAKRWCSMIALYTGCRIGEATQLRREDFTTASGIQVIRITPEAGDVKDREARLVPIHPRLTELGLLDFVGRCPKGPLFYEARPASKSEAASRRYELRARDLAAWARVVAMTDPLLLKPLHSLRHRFVSLCRKAGVEDQYMKAMTGHEPGDQSERYGQFDVPTLYRELVKLRPEIVEGRGSVPAIDVDQATA